MTAAASSTACELPANGEHTSRVAAPVIYADDARRELHEAPAELRRFGETSVVALVEDASLAGSAGGDPRRVFSAPSWAERRDLCEAVRFREQPAAASCSGVLTGEDLVLTAGHCARNLDCANLHVVFGYHYSARGEAKALDPSDVYRCAEVISFEIPSLLDRVDYGWIRLDRPVSADKRPAAVAHTAEALDDDEALHVLDFGGGLPLKVQSGVRVHDARPAELDYFISAIDTFEASSGGPLIRGDGTVVGVLARGKPDYVDDPAGCRDLSVLPDSLAGEQVTYAFQAVAGLCSGGRKGEAPCDVDGPTPSLASCSTRPGPSESWLWGGVAWLAAAAALKRRSPARR